MSAKKEKKYDYDFQQDLNHEIPKIRNITEVNAWSKPGWTGTVPKTNEMDDGVNRVNAEPGSPSKKHTWEKPTWAVVDRKNTTKSSNQTVVSSDGYNSSEIVNEAVIQPNQHPILKTSHAQLSRIEKQKKQELEDQIKALEAELAAAAAVKDTKTKGTTTGAAATPEASSRSKWGGSYSTNTGTTSQQSAAVVDNTVIDTSQLTEKERYDELRRIAKEKEDAAWRAREQERRMEAKLAQEKARTEALALAKQQQSK